MSFLFDQFTKLRRQNDKNHNGFNVSEIPKAQNHRLGITETGSPVFFIMCDGEDAGPIDYNLEFISVRFNVKCRLISENKTESDGIYSILTLKELASDLEQYFLDVGYMLVLNLPVKPKMRDLLHELNKLVDLFSKFSQPSTKTVQGLWAELLIIEQSKNPSYLLNSWHYTPRDQFDFNDGFDKIEVKSTSGKARIHTFSLEQLTPNLTSNSLIISVYTRQTSSGVGVFELSNLIEKKLTEKADIFTLKEKIAEALGADYEKALDSFYDYHYAVDNVAYYNGQSIPTFSRELIPPSILNVHFDCNLDMINQIPHNALAGKLHSYL